MVLIITIIIIINHFFLNSSFFEFVGHLKWIILITLIVVLFVGTSFVTLWSLVLPKVEHSLYFHRNKELTLNNKLQQPIGVIIDENISVSN